MPGGMPGIGGNTTVMQESVTEVVAEPVVPPQRDNVNEVQEEATEVVVPPEPVAEQ
ncbi:hypothetical protein FRC11_010727, partial [Ceratobasidium sp. 423]